MIGAPPAPPPFGVQGAAPAYGEPPYLGESFSPGEGDWQFYRQPNGWITSGQIAAEKRRELEKNYINEGWRPLREYGQFDLDPYYAHNPFEVLFLRGGAHEMPREQVIALGFHLRPPLLPRCGAQIGADHKARTKTKRHINWCWQGARPVQFPQLEGQTFVKPDGCPFCEREEFATLKQRLQHVRVMHKEEMTQMSLGEQIGKVVRGAMGGLSIEGSGTVVTSEAAASAAVERAAEASEQRELKAARAEEARLTLLMKEIGVVSDEELIAASREDGPGEVPEPAARPKRSRKSGE